MAKIRSTNWFALNRHSSLTILMNLVLPMACSTRTRILEIFPVGKYDGSTFSDKQQINMCMANRLIVFILQLANYLYIRAMIYYYVIAAIVERGRCLLAEECFHGLMPMRSRHSIFQLSMVFFSLSKFMPTFTTGRPQRAKREG